MLFCRCHSKDKNLLYFFERYYICYIVNIIEKYNYSLLQYESTKYLLFLTKNIYYLYIYIYIYIYNFNKKIIKKKLFIIYTR